MLAEPDETFLLLQLREHHVRTRVYRLAANVLNLPFTRAALNEVCTCVRIDTGRPGTLLVERPSDKRLDDFSLVRLRTLYPSFHRTTDHAETYAFGDLNEFLHFRLTWESA